MLDSSIRAPVVMASEPGLRKHLINTGWTHSHSVLIQHHKGKASISSIQMGEEKLNDHLLLPGLLPLVSRDPAVMHLHLPVALSPVIKRAGGYPNPSDKPGDINPCSPGPVSNEIHNPIPRIVRHPHGL